MNQSVLEELLEAKAAGRECVLVTIAATSGSVPRQAGTRMIVYRSGEISGTVEGGKFEALVVEDSLATLRIGKPELKTYVLREGSADSFGAICGGEVTALLEPQTQSDTIYLFGAGHCAMAIARLARTCGFRTVLIEDRPEIVQSFYDELKQRGVDPADFKLVHAPIGLDIGADSPEEIAVSVMAEVLSVLRGQSGESISIRTKTEQG